MTTHTIDEKCGCGAEFHWTGGYATSVGGPLVSEWRANHRHAEPATVAPSWSASLLTMHHGICPGCRQFKFIGHGPLCLDCLTNPTTPDAHPASRESEQAAAGAGL